MLELTRRSFLFSMAPVLLPAESALPRPRRSESFFGVHLDLHPNPSDPALGRDVSDEMVEDFLAKVKPDFVQYDCKAMSDTWVILRRSELPRLTSSTTRSPYGGESLRAMASRSIFIFPASGFPRGGRPSGLGAPEARWRRRFQRDQHIRSLLPTC